MNLEPGGSQSLGGLKEGTIVNFRHADYAPFRFRLELPGGWVVEFNSRPNDVTTITVGQGDGSPVNISMKPIEGADLGSMRRADHGDGAGEEGK